MSYETVLRERVIRDFIKTYSRAPNVDEIKVAMNEVRKKHVNLENRGFSALEVKLPSFLDVSSAADENQNRQATDDDLKALAANIKTLSNGLETDYRDFRLRATELRRYAESLESQMNTILLGLGSEDAFVSSAREDFTMAFTTPEDDTTATVENGYCLAARDSLQKIDISRADVTFSPISSNRILSKTATAPSSSILELDGKTYEYVVLVNRQRSSVDLVLTIEFSQPEDVGEVRVAMTPQSAAAPEVYSAFYSTDGSDFELLEPSARPRETASLLIPVSKSQVKSLRLVFSKRVADARTTSFNQWAFVWQFDAVEVFRQSYAQNADYTWSGVYTLNTATKDTTEAVSKVSLDVCTIEPPGTKIEWYVAADQTDAPWYSINPYREALDIVSIRTLDTSSLSLLDAGEDEDALLNPRDYSAADVVDPNCLIFNKYFDGQWNINPEDVTILLDWVSGDGTDNKSTGWHINELGNYETWIYVGSPEGKRLDLGPRGAKIDDRVVSGLAYLNAGWHKFETAQDNYRVVDSGAVSESNLRLIDTLYPFNHKYVIEGYEYSSDFEGKQLYSGVDSRAGKVLRYLVPDQFDSTDDLWTWTFEVMPGFGTIIVTRVDQTKAQILDGEPRVVWRGVPVTESGAQGEDVKVRAVLHTSSDGLTPLIDWFVIRGI